jgi:hypothetical protein
MAYGISHFFPRGTKAQYEAVMIALNGKLGTIPEGQIFHAAGPAPGGWQIVGVHDTKESWERFVQTRFIPLMGKGIEGGFAAPPTETLWDVTHFYK